MALFYLLIDDVFFSWLHKDHQDSRQIIPFSSWLVLQVFAIGESSVMAFLTTTFLYVDTYILYYYMVE